jgi:hypothetical protein
MGMKNVSVRPQTEAINGTMCRVIDASNEKQRFTLWLDPSHGYQVAQAKYEDRNLSATFGDVRFEKHGDVWVPMQGTSHMIWSKFGKIVSDATLRIKRTSIDLKPDFEAVGAFVPGLPDGIRVRIHENPGLRYVWQNGRIVPEIDDSAISAIDKTVTGLAPVANEEIPALSAVATPVIAAKNRGVAGADAPQVTESSQWLWWVLAVAGALVLMATQWCRQRYASACSSAVADRRMP